MLHCVLALREGDVCTAEQVQERTGLGAEEVQACLAQFERDGIVERESACKGKYLFWRLTEPWRELVG